MTGLISLRRDYSFAEIKVKFPTLGLFRQGQRPSGESPCGH